MAIQPWVVVVVLVWLVYSNSQWVAAVAEARRFENKYNEARLECRRAERLLREWRQGPRGLS